MFLINSRWIKKEPDGDIHNFTELNTDIDCFGTLREEGIISMGLSQKVKGIFNHKGWFQWTFNFMLRKII